MTLNIAARVFISTDVGRDTNQLITAFVELLESVMSVVRVDFPGLLYHKGMNARRFLAQYFKDLTPDKRHNDDSDIMSYLCKEHDENGEFFSDEAIAEHLIFLMLAAHDTTTSALINTFYFLAAYPEWQTRVREEVKSLHKGFLNYEELDDLEILENMFKETTRLFPPAINFMRRTVRECELGGYEIPANTVITLSPVFTQRMEEWWTDPLKFDPDRFAAPREEHKRPPFSWFPFGGGAHKCIGMHFATMLYKCIIFQVIQKYQFSLPDGYPMPTDNSNFMWVPMPKPKDNLPLILHRIQ
jgi:cytochrome P450